MAFAATGRRQAWKADFAESSEPPFWVKAVVLLFLLICAAYLITR